MPDDDDLSSSSNFTCSLYLVLDIASWRDILEVDAGARWLTPKTADLDKGSAQTILEQETAEGCIQQVVDGGCQVLGAGETLQNSASNPEFRSPNLDPVNPVCRAPHPA